MRLPLPVAQIQVWHFVVYTISFFCLQMVKAGNRLSNGIMTLIIMKWCSSDLVLITRSGLNLLEPISSFADISNLGVTVNLIWWLHNCNVDDTAMYTACSNRQCWRGFLFDNHIINTCGHLTSPLHPVDPFSYTRFSHAPWINL